MTSNGSDTAPLRPMSSFQPASNLPRDMNSSAIGRVDGTGATAGASTDANGARPGVAQPRPRPLIRGAVGSGNTVLVNSCQRGNPVLQHIRNIGWEYADIVPDYQVGLASCVLFLSIRYHRLHPEYVHTRIQKLQQMYTLRILLVMCDVNDHQAAIRELTKVALINNLTMMVAWSAEEAGRYIETYKSFEHKPPDLIKERVSDDYMSQLTNVLTTVRGVNKTDVVTLISTFGSLERISKATAEELSMCPGFGEIKARRLRDVFHQPFRVGETRSRKERRRPEQAPTESTIPSTMRAADLLELTAADSFLDSTASNAPQDASSTTVANSEPSAQPVRALDALEQNFDGLTEEEQLKLAMELSMADPGDDDDVSDNDVTVVD
ncbi:hypothetical protein BCV70DRAFT_25436 [Testicularia cyperi]|uniref:DNA excision repair protein ERCC-1 n=1 Tax=Testicularia cyperi TaxID=1882483 RepID=A0A317XMU9_9BASI|nr:hypothetical protein BCV70DRAFT_25436 [Testicularia cyperi]